MSNTSQINVSREWELKYLITEEDYLIFSAKGDKITQINYYFFSEYEDFTCRIREKKGEYEFTYKVKTDIDGIRVEHNRAISHELFSSLLENGISEDVFYSLVGVMPKASLRYVGFLKTERTAFWYENLKIEVDKNSYLDRVDYEVECEVTSNEEYAKAKSYLISHFHTNKSETKTKRFRIALNQSILL